MKYFLLFSILLASCSTVPITNLQANDHFSVSQWQKTGDCVVEKVYDHKYVTARCTFKGLPDERRMQFVLKYNNIYETHQQEAPNREIAPKSPSLLHF